MAGSEKDGSMLKTDLLEVRTEKVGWMPQPEWPMVRELLAVEAKVAGGATRRWER
jgi:hypothetical protein